MRRAFLVLVFVAALAIGVIAFLPASIVDGRIAAATDGRLRVAEASGTIWNGQGVLGDATGAWRVPFAWRIDPLAVLRGEREVTLLPAAGAATPAGTIAIAGNTAVVRELTLELPAAALVALAPSRAILAAGGTVSIVAPSLRLDPAAPDGTLDARWSNARIVTALAAAELGTVRLAVRPQGGSLAGTLTNEGGDVTIDGTARYAAPTLAVEATLAAVPSAPPPIAQLLGMLGPASDGRVRIAWRGNLR